MRPRVAKHGNVWRVYIGAHMYAARPTLPLAMREAQQLAERRNRTRAAHYLHRARQALHRMDNRPA